MLSVFHFKRPTQLSSKLFVVEKMFEVKLGLFRGRHLLVQMDVLSKFQDDLYFF